MSRSPVLALVLSLAYIPLCGASYGQEPAKAATRGESNPRVDPPEQARPIDIARSINSKLQRLCIELRGAPANASPKAEQVGDLIERLTELEGLNGRLGRLGAGLADEGLRGVRAQTLHHRAVAWLNAWWAYGVLIERASRSGDDQQRVRLVGTDTKSALGLLLRSYTQIRQGEEDQARRIAALRDREANPNRRKEMEEWLTSARTDEPLLTRLVNSTSLDDMLGCPEEFRSRNRPVGAPHGYRIPTVAELVGHPNDLPRRSDPSTGRTLLTLLSLVNLQLDTWHNANPGNAEQLAVGPLADWLDQLHSLHTRQEDPYLKAFDTAATPSPLGELTAERASRMAKFLQFRGEYDTDGKLGTLLSRVRDARTPPFDGIEKVLPDLVGAARPVSVKSDKGQDTQEYLYDAVVWLRYVLLLSYRTDRMAILEERAGNALLPVWNSLKLGYPLEWERTAPPEDYPGGFLRWNRPPDPGHSSAVIADITRAALASLSFEKQIRDLEPSRFRLITTTAGVDSKDYATRLGTALGGLQAVFDRCLRPYRLDFPLAIGVPAFRKSATSSEQSRLYDDVEALTDQIQVALQRDGLMREIYLSGDPQRIALAMRSLGGLTGLSNWDIHALPARTFQQYHDDLKREVGRLRELADALDAERILRAEYESRQGQLRVAQLNLAAAQLGRTIAEKAIRVSEIYEKVAQIDLEIADLGVRVAQLEKEGTSNQLQAAGMRLAYATRLRDLASARVDALLQASEEASAIAKEAEKELDSLADQFERIASQIEEEKKSSGLFGVIKAIVNVVGAVLAPFTGGASLAVAAIVNKGLDIYQKIDKGDWRDPLRAAATIADVAGEVEGALKLGIDSFGGAEAKQWFAEMQTHITSVRDKLEQFRDLGERGKKILDGIKSLEKGDAVQFVSALANGFPLALGDGGSVRIDFGAKKLEFRDPNLQKALHEVFEAGGHIINDADARRLLKDLPGLPDHLLTGKLKEAIDGGVQALPPDIRGRILNLPSVAEEQFQAELRKKREQLKDVIGRNLSEADRRVLATALAGGMLFVEKGEVVVAFERPLEKEIERFNKRLQAVANQEWKQAVDGIVKSLEGRRDRLNSEAEKLVRDKNEGGLRALADRTKAMEIPAIKKDVQDLDNQVEVVKGELEDRDTEAKIANYEAEAARLRAEAADLNYNIAAKRQERARLLIQAARLQGEMAQLSDQQAKIKIDAAAESLKLAEADLRTAYNECLIRGINPLAQESAESAAQRQAMAVRVRGLLAGYRDDTDLYNKAVVDRMASDVVGMIQWINLLRLQQGPETTPRTRVIEEGGGSREPRTSLDWYSAVLQALTSTQRPYVKDAKAENHVAGRLQLIAEELESLFQDNAGNNADVRIETRQVSFDQIRWFRSRNDAELASLFPDVPDELRKQVIGTFRLRVSTEITPPLEQNGIPDIIPRGDTRRFAYYVDVNRLLMISPESNLSFLTLAPDHSRVHETWPVAADYEDQPHLLQLQEIPSHVYFSGEDPLVEDRYREQLRLWKPLKYAGGLGEWTFLILANGVKSEEARRFRLSSIKPQGFDLKIKILFLDVKMN